MKRIIPLFLVAVAVAFGTQAQNGLSKEDKAKVLAHMKQTSKDLAKITKSLSEEQLNFKPSEDVWSVAECVEHLAITETGFMEMVNGMLKTEANPENRSEIKMTDDQVLEIIENREQKVKTSPQMEPTNSYDGATGSLAAFSAKRKEIMKMVKGTSEDFRNRSFDLPFGKLDGVQVLLFISGHTRRHIKQMEEVMAGEGFPKS